MQIVVNKQPMELEAGRRFTCIVHQQGIRVDIPEAVEINGRNTIDCMEKMSQRAWEHISTGQLFRMLFTTVFPPEDYNDRPHDPDDEFPPPEPQYVDIEVPDEEGKTKTERIGIGMRPGVPIPATIEELNSGDFGVIHVSGMIVLGCEAIFAGKTKIFFRTPEDHLHPKAERRIVGMFRQMMILAGAAGTITEEAPRVADAATGITQYLPEDVPPAPEPPKKRRRKKKDDS
jgi:hypothetical protein